MTDERGAYVTCKCPMTWGCKQPATSDDELCDACRVECAKPDEESS